MDLIFFLIKINEIIQKEGNLKKIYNIVGKDKKYLWDLYYQIASYKKKRVLKINIFQQLLTIDHSKFIGKKTTL